MTTTLATVPSELPAVRRALAQWRQTRRLGARIPASLWASAVAVARREGVYRTARALHLEGRKLKQLVTGAEPTPRGTAVAPTFVEVFTPPAAGVSACTIEMEAPRGGRLRVQMQGGRLPDLVALSRVVWGRQA